MEKELKSILKSEHLEYLAPKFKKQGVTDEILDQLEDTDLRELGVEKLGERKRLLSAFAHNRDMPLAEMVLVDGGELPVDSELSGTRVQEFEIGKYPIMHGEWEWVRIWAQAKGYELEIGDGAGSSHPVTDISWYDAVKWCNAKSEHEALQPVYTIDGQILRKGDFGPSGSKWIGRDEHANGYRLPLEVEWEWAARGGVLGKKRTPEGTPPGSGILDPDPIVNKVLSIFYNQLGIYDITSNMWEWCWDRDETGAAHRIRASIEDSGKKLSDGSHRISRSPDTRYSVLGFRLARNL